MTRWLWLLLALCVLAWPARANPPAVEQVRTLVQAEAVRGH